MSKEGKTGIFCKKFVFKPDEIIVIVDGKHKHFVRYPYDFETRSGQQFIVSYSKLNYTIKDLDIYIDDEYVGDIRWFSLEKFGKRRALKEYEFVKVSSKQQIIFNYFINFFTLGLAGSIFINKQNKELKKWSTIVSQLKAKISRLFKEQLEYKHFRSQIGDSYDLEALAALKKKYGTIKDISFYLEQFESPQEIRLALSLRNSQGSFEKLEQQLKNIDEYENAGLNTKNQRVTFLISTLGNESEIEKAYQLKAIHGSFFTLENKLINLQNERKYLKEIEAKFNTLISTFGSLEAIQEFRDKAHEFDKFDMELKEKDIEIFNKNNEIKALSIRDQQLYTYERELGGFDELNQAIEVKRLHGDFSQIKDKLESFNQITLLREKIEKLEDRDQRWLVVSNGVTLEAREKLRVEEKTKISTKEETNDFEEQLTKMMTDLFPPGMSGVRWERQKECDKYTADFYVEYLNANNRPRFSVIIECKSAYHISAFSKAINSSKDKLETNLKKGLKHLEDCSKHLVVNLGLLVTSYEFIGHDTYGIGEIPEAFLTKKLSMSKLPIRLVNWKHLHFVLWSLYLMNICYKPEQELVIDLKVKSAKLSNSEYIKMLKDMDKAMPTIRSKFRLARDRASDIQKHAANCSDYLNEIWEFITEFDQMVNKQLTKTLAFMDNPAKLLEDSKEVEVMVTSHQKTPKPKP